MTGRVLGIDPGTVRIGLALSDPSGIIASPLSVLTRRSAAEDMAALRTLVAEHEVERVVIGLPRLMDGRLDAAAAAAQGKRRRQRRADVDRMAAALLLQSYLDYRGSRGSGG